MDELTIRPAREDDLSALVAIYNREVETGIATFDTEPVTTEHFAQRLGGGPAEAFLVAEASGTVLGYAYAGPFRPRPAYAGTRETSVYLAEPVRGRGAGRALYLELLGRLDAAGVHTQVAVVALPNDASEALHRAVGFRPVGVLREVGHKFGRWIDTAWYQRRP